MYLEGTLHPCSSPFPMPSLPVCRDNGCSVARLRCEPGVSRDGSYLGPKTVPFVAVVRAMPPPPPHPTASASTRIVCSTDLTCQCAEGGGRRSGVGAGAGRHAPSSPTWPSPQHSCMVASIQVAAPGMYPSCSESAFSEKTRFRGVAFIHSSPP